jgi:hypothetical protein
VGAQPLQTAPGIVTAAAPPPPWPMYGPTVPFHAPGSTALPLLYSLRLTHDQVAHLAAASAEAQLYRRIAPAQAVEMLQEAQQSTAAGPVQAVQPQPAARRYGATIQQLPEAAQQYGLTMLPQAVQVAPRVQPGTGPPHVLPHSAATPVLSGGVVQGCLAQGHSSPATAAAQLEQPYHSTPTTGAARGQAGCSSSSSSEKQLSGPRRCFWGPLPRDMSSEPPVPARAAAARGGGRGSSRRGGRGADPSWLLSPLGDWISDSQGRDTPLGACLWAQHAGYRNLLLLWLGRQVRGGGWAGRAGRRKRRRRCSDAHNLCCAMASVRVCLDTVLSAVR